MRGREGQRRERFGALRIPSGTHPFPDEKATSAPPPLLLPHVLLLFCFPKMMEKDIRAGGSLTIWVQLLYLPAAFPVSVLHATYLKNHIQGWREDSVGKAFPM